MAVYSDVNIQKYLPKATIKAALTYYNPAKGIYKPIAPPPPPPPRYIVPGGKGPNAPINITHAEDRVRPAYYPNPLAQYYPAANPLEKYYPSANPLAKYYPKSNPMEQYYYQMFSNKGMGKPAPLPQKEMAKVQFKERAKYQAKESSKTFPYLDMPTYPSYPESPYADYGSGGGGGGYGAGYRPDWMTGLFQLSANRA